MDFGYAPGPRHDLALARGASDAAFLRLRTNGLALHVGRRVFHSGGNGPELTCGGCGLTFEPGAEWYEASDAWLEGHEATAFHCPACKHGQRVVEWRGPWAWGFGNLGLEFWNWPFLSEAFVHDVTERIQHRTVVVKSHL